MSSPRKSTTMMLPPGSLAMLVVDANRPLIDLLGSMETDRMFF